ncbi:MAG: TlpA family protein disulfide reductase [Pirellulaceae bacterium]|nr:TlpA family protein disulfide reductase [Pirellulaceae bacterium]
MNSKSLILLAGLSLLMPNVASAQDEKKTVKATRLVKAKVADEKKDQSKKGTGRTKSEAVLNPFSFQWGEVDPTLPDVDVPEKKYYAANIVLNKRLPDFYVEKWLGEEPQLEGKMVLIDFWATSCKPCLADVPKLNKWHKKYGDRLAIVGITSEPERLIRKMEKPVMDYYSAIDSSKKLTRHIQVRGIPHVVLVDPSGTVRWQGLPNLKNHSLTEEVLEGLLDTYLKK